jgi:hypothetical protein
LVAHQNQRQVLRPICTPPLPFRLPREESWRLRLCHREQCFGSLESRQPDQARVQPQGLRTHLLITRLASAHSTAQQKQQQLSTPVAAKSATHSRQQLYRQHLGPEILAGSAPRGRHLNSESPPMSSRVCAAATRARALGSRPCEDVFGSASSWRRPRDALPAIALTEKCPGPEWPSRSGGMSLRESQNDLSRRPTCRCGPGAQDPAANRGTLAQPPCARQRPVGRARTPQRRQRPPTRAGGRGRANRPHAPPPQSRRRTGERRRRTHRSKGGVCTCPRLALAVLLRSSASSLIGVTACGAACGEGDGRAWSWSGILAHPQLACRAPTCESHPATGHAPRPIRRHWYECSPGAPGRGEHLTLNRRARISTVHHSTTPQPRMRSAARLLRLRGACRPAVGMAGSRGQSSAVVRMAAWPPWVPAMGMAGHSKWHNIRHKKGAEDAKRSIIYAKVAYGRPPAPRPPARACTHSCPRRCPRLPATPQHARALPEAADSATLACGAERSMQVRAAMNHGGNSPTNGAWPAGACPAP